ncbi:MAG TPA: poly(ADP-ribose) glycohydrolase domain-containing protein, partial [Ktedonobacteraceae bacterium]|nr:poly(ADP-ribose) glycohydrolase domain-containing protein [Ktedonobacteraceae bacterium]
MDAKAIAQGTVAALEQGHYIAPEGNTIDLTGLLATCLSSTQTYDPEDLVRLREHVLAQPVSQQAATFAVVNETTLQGCARLIASQQYQ